MSERCVAVAAPLPLDRTYDYLAPADTPEGALVEVELGRGRVLGVVWGEGELDPSDRRLKRVARVLDEKPLRPELRAFLARLADYTLTPVGVVARLAPRAPGLGEPPPSRSLYRSGAAAEPPPEARFRVLAALAEQGGAPSPPGELARAAGVSPGVLKAMEQAGQLIRETVARDAPYPRLDPDRAPQALSGAQQAAAEALREAVAAGRYSATLLKGVTGSGKTEVYLEAVAETLRRGRQALVMLPEIALTASFIERLTARFGAAPAEWHSGVGGAERRRLWRAAASGDAQVVVGARSALFLPYRALGLIVIDEEHDAAYKQEEGALYNARDMGVLRASVEGCACVLASATPSLESWANAESGKYARLDLPERFGAAVMPRLQTVDLRRERLERNRWIAAPLRRAVAERLRLGEQSLLFLNRRGYAPLTVCRACGHFFECPHCDARLVEHRFRRSLICHHCGYAEPEPDACPKCGEEGRLAASGPGVERLAEEAGLLFPEARLAVLSSDMTASPEQLRAQVVAIAEGGADLVIGTQMVAKGHDFPLLTLVGVIDADLGLQNGELRAAERTFQLVRQVSGRAGRRETPGLCLIQTAAPEHPVMRAILDGDEERFLRSEAAQREAQGAPPYARMAALIVSGMDEEKVWTAARALAATSPMLDRAGLRMFGPVAAPVARIRGRHRVRMLVKGPKGAPLQAALRAWLATAAPAASVRVAVDVDPQSFY